MPTSPELIDAGLRRLIRFLTDAELQSLGTQIGLGEEIDEEHILVATSGLPHYEVVRLFLKAATPTLLLLRQVFDALEVLGVHARTTGCLFVLANPSKPGERTELVFSPQAVGMVAVWPLEKEWNRLVTSLQDLKRRWFAFKRELDQLIDDSKGKWEEGDDLDVVESYIRQESVYEQEYREDKDAQKVLSYFLNQIAAFGSRLEAAAQGTLPPEIESIMRDTRRLLVDGEVKRSRSQRWESKSPDERPEEWIVRRYVNPRFVSDFDKFLEDPSRPSPWIRSASRYDLLRLDIWSSRPQLYEVWVMLSVLRWFESQGYWVQLRRAKDTQDEAPFEWDLAYSRDSRPCAIIWDSPSKPIGYLFYQLYRSSGDMPDISMLKEADASSAPMWSLDPKHSLKGGYSLADYRRTAERYRDSFGATLSLVAEYFPRPWSNPTDFGNGAKLIVDCNPSGSGLPLLLAELETLHPPATKRLAKQLLCVDFSSSFANRRDNALQELRSRLPRGTRFVEEYICFAGNSVRIGGTTSWLLGGMLANPHLNDGTSFASLYEVISNVVKTTIVERVILVTDGQFEIALELAETQLKDELGVGVEVIM
jgi:hypothetical protein